MVRRFLGLLAAALLSAGSAHAVEGDAQSSAPPPLVKEPASGMELVFVKGGCFQMGDLYDDGLSGSGQSEDEKPVHEVCVGDFYIGKHEVTQGQWRAVMGSHASSVATCSQDDCPVDSVTFDDIQEFMRRLGSKGTGGKYRLPTEAEWEYAARSGGRIEKYSGGNDVESVAWYTANSGPRENRGHSVARPVGTKAPNGLGIFDMSGNVYELTSDFYERDYYSRSPRDNPAGPSSGAGDRVQRGGCSSGHPGNTRVARRSEGGGGGASDGFRVVRVP